ncbi:LysM peptidoglycan-binding domain-containing protein [Longirhabdus pacifica]|uniref:LysM peptidoglycan-binding domain-containing protein n=1 Tax=Longirhabdus pacifica TaxID=2305227 RepID=UPI0010093966|nr:LysM peptidoglycan-binding domain-containing protein [Longirhabdus pacifica]
MLIHVVQSGESLWSIAKQYNTNPNQISSANQLRNPNQLAVGQSLVIPSPYTYHVIQEGESLYRIAEQYRTTVDAIVTLNNITNPALIYPGVRLLIPPTIHTVKMGESVSQIARDYQVTVQQLLNANQITDPNLIQAGSSIIIPFKRDEIEVSAFLLDMGEEGAQLVSQVDPYLTFIIPFTYIFSADGSLNALNDEPVIQTAQQENIVPIMAVTNFTFNDPGSTLANTLLSSEALQTKLLTEAIAIMKQKQYKGINFDFENVLPEDREKYNQFVQLAVDMLHPEGFFVSTSLAPKYSADQKGLLYEAHDYAFHGNVADFVILMTYEWGYRKGPPQAISPINQIERVLDYAVSVMPRDKIVMGFQIYARDWLLPHVQGQEAQTFSPQEAEQRAIESNAAIQYDVLAQSPYYQYYDEQGRAHEVWFEDARSALAKFDTAKKYNLRGIAYWVLGYPFPQNFLLLDDQFDIKKYSSS